MNKPRYASDGNYPEAVKLPARSWAGFVNDFSARVAETRRVIKSGGLQQPGVAEHLQASRASSAPPGGYSDT
jgi:hypothetical protein